MRGELSAYEIQEWKAYLYLEPSGPFGDYYRTGILAALFFNANKTKEAQLKAPSDFMPESLFNKDSTDDEDSMSAEDIAGVFRAMRDIHNAGGIRQE